jgi:hypothetical protein
MTDDAWLQPVPDRANHARVCPWCSATLPAESVAVCPSCEARLVDSSGTDIPGVNAVDPALLAAAAAPRKVKRTFGSLLVRDDPDNPPPTPQEMPAIAPPDDAVRREMLRLELEARLADLQAEVAALDADEGKTPGGLPRVPPADDAGDE